MSSRTHDCLTVGNHHVQRHTDGCLHAVKDHAQRISNQKQITVWVEKMGHRSRVCSQADDRVLTLHPTNAWRCQSPLVRVSTAHDTSLSVLVPQGRIIRLSSRRVAPIRTNRARTTGSTIS